MERENNYHQTVRLLSKKYPTLPLWKIERQVKKYKGNMMEAEAVLQEKEMKVKQKMNLTEEQVGEIGKRFTKFRKDFLYKKAGECGSVRELEELLEGEEKRGRNKGRYRNVEEKYRLGGEGEGEREERGEMNEEKIERGEGEERKHRHKRQHRYQQREEKRHHDNQGIKLETSAILFQVKKLFPKLEDQRINEEINKMCWKLQKISRKQEQKDKPQNYKQSLQLIGELTGLPQRQIRRKFQQLHYNVDGTIQCLLSVETTSIKSCLQIQSTPTLYIDGNNLLYLNKHIRSITLQQGKILGSLALSKVLNEFNKGAKKRIFLVFDNMKGEVEFQNIKIEVSKPKFKSSDDFLVDVASRLGEEERGKCMFVTSDKKLLQRLNERKGGNLMRARVFMGIVENGVPDIGEIVKVQ